MRRASGSATPADQVRVTKPDALLVFDLTLAMIIPHCMALLEPQQPEMVMRRNITTPGASVLPIFACYMHVKACKHAGRFA